MIAGGEKSGGLWGQLVEVMMPGVRAVRRHWAPFLLLQAAAACLVVSYYHFAPVRTVAHAIGIAKQEWGIWFVIISGACAGGLLPQLAKAVTNQSGRIDRKFWSDTAYIGFVFAVVAVGVNLFYFLQTDLFGSRIDVATLAKKTALDMFVFTPFVVLPVSMGLFYFRSVGFKLERFRDILTWRFFRTYVITTLPINWAFWIPVLFCVYALPSDLQFPFAQLAEGAWSLLFVFIATDAQPIS